MERTDGSETSLRKPSRIRQATGKIEEGAGKFNDPLRDPCRRDERF
jgi:hypothetical protein